MSLSEFGTRDPELTHPNELEVHELTEAAVLECDELRGQVESYRDDLDLWHIRTVLRTDAPEDGSVWETLTCEEDEFPLELICSD